jgi:hypothetical protein
MRSRRPRTSLTFGILGLLLLVSVAVGQRIGDRVIFGSTDRRVPVAAPLATPVPDASAADPNVSRNWKRLQVVSVATDPAFPDPRVTRSPEPTPKPTPRPTPTPSPPPVYTSPPMPVPLLTHDPNEIPAVP